MNGAKTVFRISALVGLMCLLSGCDLIRFMFPKDGLRAWSDENGNLVVHAKGRTFSDRDTRLPADATKDVKFVIPQSYKPRVLSGHLSVIVQLSPMKRLDPQPPFPPEFEANLWLYSQQRLSNPETRKRWEDLRQQSLTQKGVVVELLAPAFSTSRIKTVYSQFAFKYDPDQPPGVLKRLRYGSSEYVRDWDVAGLRRFSRMHCYSPGQLEPIPQMPQDKGYLRARAFLKHKPPDDPTPENCRLNRHNSFFISPEDVPIDDVVFIDCDPVIWQCDVRFAAGRRAVKLKVEEFEVPLWRDIVDPIRQRINSFVDDR